VPHELHVLPGSVHGVGLAADAPAGAWARLCADWLGRLPHLAVPAGVLSAPTAIIALAGVQVHATRLPGSPAVKVDARGASGAARSALPMLSYPARLQ